MGSVAKVFVTDIDGTLLGADGDVHPSDAEAIAALIARGVPVALCTGRMYSGTREIAESLRILGPVACIDGSHIVDSTNHLELHSTPLSDVATELLFEALGHIPVEGEEVVVAGVGLRAERVQGRRITRVRVTPAAQAFDEPVDIEPRRERR